MVKIYSRRTLVKEKEGGIGKLRNYNVEEVLIDPTEEILSMANYKKHIRFLLKGEFSSLDEYLSTIDDGYDRVDVLYAGAEECT